LLFPPAQGTSVIAFSEHPCSRRNLPRQCAHVRHFFFPNRSSPPALPNNLLIFPSFNMRRVPHSPSHGAPSAIIADPSPFPVPETAFGPLSPVYNCRALCMVAASLIYPFTGQPKAFRLKLVAISLSAPAFPNMRLAKRVSFSCIGTGISQNTRRNFPIPDTLYHFTSRTIGFPAVMARGYRDGILRAVHFARLAPPRLCKLALQFPSVALSRVLDRRELFEFSSRLFVSPPLLQSRAPLFPGGGMVFLIDRPIDLLPLSLRRHLTSQVKSLVAGASPLVSPDRLPEETEKSPTRMTT